MASESSFSKAQKRFVDHEWIKIQWSGNQCAFCRDRNAFARN